jgi:cell division protein FtsN
LNPEIPKYVWYNPIFNRRTLSKRGCIVGFILFLVLLSYHVDAQNDPVYDEISVFLQVKDIGQIEIPAIIQEDVAYLPIKEIFEFLNFKTTMSQSMDSISGFLISIKEPYIVDFKNLKINFQGKQFQLKKGEMIRTETNLYLRSNFFGEIFGLNCRFSFRNLSVSMQTTLELPAMREKRLEQMRQNINRVEGIIRADTLIQGKHPFFHVGMADWSMISTQDIGKKVDNRINMALGMVLAGGEANVLLNLNTNEQFTEKQQYYTLKYVNNDRSWLRQTILGKIGTDAVSSIYNPVVGIRFTNTPTTYRRSFGTYSVSDYTNPNWTVELYVNNILVDYKIADASGFFTFQVPLVYGNSLVKFKFYGPWGEERSKEQTLTIPFNFIPVKKLEYTASGGIVEDGKGSIFSRVNANYGLSKYMTLGAGVEYLSSVESNTTMPFASFTARPLSNLILSEDYMYGVRSKTILNYQFPKNIQLELNYIKYDPGQKAVNYNYLEERKAIFTLPIKIKKSAFYNRMSYDKIIMPGTQYSTAEWLISGTLWGFNTNLTNNAMFSENSDPYIYSNLSTSIRLPKGYMLLPQAQFNYTHGQIISAKLGMEKYVFKNGFLSVSYENNFLSGTQMAQFGFRYDLSFAQAGFTVRQSESGTTTMEMARGSLIMDAKTHYFGANNRVSVGKGAIVFSPFLDLNCNNRWDPGEPKEFDLNIRISGGRPFQNEKDSTIRVVDLEPYTTYFVEFDQNSFNNVAWKLRKKTMNIIVDPNMFKLVEVPISVVGEVSGTISKKGQGESKGIGRIVVNFFNLKAQQVGKTLTEPDGYFNFLGLAPGKYYAQVDTTQLKRIQMKCEPDTLQFSIKQSRDGDIVEGKDFLLTSTKKEDEILPNEKVEVPQSAPAIVPFTDLHPDTTKVIPVKTSTDATRKILKDEKLSQVATPKDTAKKIVNNVKPSMAETPKKSLIQTIAKPNIIALPDTVNKPSDGLFYIQVGAFKIKENAKKLSLKISGIANCPVIVILESDLYKVRLGGFTKKEELNACKETILKSGLFKADQINEILPKKLKKK